jgi:hypothetical protein
MSANELRQQNSRITIIFDRILADTTSITLILHAWFSGP